MVGPAGQTDWYRLAGFAPSIKSLLGGAYLQEKDAPAGRKTIADALLGGEADAPLAAWLDIDKVVVEVLGKVREGTISVREGLADIDRRVTAAVQPR